MDGSATVTIVESSTVMNCATQEAARIAPRRRPPGGDATSGAIVVAVLAVVLAVPEARDVPTLAHGHPPEEQ